MKILGFPVVLDEKMNSTEIKIKVGSLNEGAFPVMEVELEITNKMAKYRRVGERWEKIPYDIGCVLFFLLEERNKQEKK